ncbi:Sodium-coupled monocarboxylate transporter 1 [Branchiostoma belcheri]|nr:Sodium-coupled monocarboxylate transporter 1 [Branchiostoma belcheri]
MAALLASDQSASSRGMVAPIVEPLTSTSSVTPDQYYVIGSQDPKKVDPKLIVPFYDSLFCCLPNRWLKWLRCGVRHGEPEGDKAGLDVELSPVTSGLPPTDQGTSPPEAALYELSYIYLGAMATLSCVIVGLLVSFVTGDQRKLVTLDRSLKRVASHHD